MKNHVRSIKVNVLGNSIQEIVSWDSKDSQGYQAVGLEKFHCIISIYLQVFNFKIAVVTVISWHENFT